MLTDEKFFMGSPEYLYRVREAVQIPVLRKDFTIDTYQIYESRCYGADIILLIVAVLDIDQLREFQDLARELGMCSIVEVHDRNELDTALEAGSSIIGINNRDLKTFEVDTETSVRLAEFIPDDVLVISESGLGKPEHIARLREKGISTFLIGESFMVKEDPGMELRILLDSLRDMESAVNRD